MRGKSHELPRKAVDRADKPLQREVQILFSWQLQDDKEERHDEPTTICESSG